MKHSWSSRRVGRDSGGIEMALGGGFGGPGGSSGLLGGPEGVLGGSRGGGLGVSGRVSKAPKFLCYMASDGSLPNVENHRKTISFPVVVVPFLHEEAAQMIANCIGSDQCTWSWE